MTIEFSLRRRAARSRRLAVLWLALTAAILVGTYVSLPHLAIDLLTSITRIEQPSSKSNIGSQDTAAVPKRPMVSAHVFTLTTLGFGVSAVAFACYLLSRSALIEVDAAARLNGLADAICVAANEIKNFERASTILVPKPEPRDVSILSANDLKLIADTVKQLK
jgi:hypothetical protein